MTNHPSRTKAAKRKTALESLRRALAGLATSDEFTPSDHDDASQVLDRLIGIARSIGVQP